MPKLMNLIGQKFGNLTVIEQAPNRGKRVYWKCKCECGRDDCKHFTEVAACHLRSGAIKSCGACVKDNFSIPTNLIKKCEICGENFSVTQNGGSRKYCYSCSPSYKTSEERATSITILRHAMKKEAVKRKGGKCEICGYNKCIEALQFHHSNPEEKEFQVSSGNIRSWKEYWNEVQKCQLVCANCHAEIHYLKDK